MAEKVIIHKNSSLKTRAVKEALDRFNNEGELIGTGYRNVIKVLEVDGVKYNIKAFKVPNVINKIVYRFFRNPIIHNIIKYVEQFFQNICQLD